MKLLKMIAAIFLVVWYFPGCFTAASEQVAGNIEYQNKRMEYLRSEYYTSYTPCDESRFTAFDIEEAFRKGVKFNEVQFLSTHNSYQITSTEEYRNFFEAISDLTFGLVKSETAEFNMDSLTEQLEVGIRGLEIDIETVDEEGNVSFIVTHNSVMDNTSSCYDFEKALEEIKMWSDNNPGHLPVTVIIEPKKGVVPVNNMKNYSLKYAVTTDELIRKVMGETLLTPEEMMGDYESFKQMRENDGWLPLEKTMGKVLFLLHDTTVTSDYINQDKTIKSQAMFPMMRYADRKKDYASFIIDNNPKDALSHEGESIDKYNLIVRIRPDSFPDFSDEKYEKANLCKAQIVSTDFPPTMGESKYHAYSFDGYTVKLQQNLK